MPARGIKECLYDIRDAIADIQAFTREMTRDAFLRLPDEDGKTYRAIKNAFSEIAEAVKHLPDDVYARHSSIDWRGFAGLRELMAHRYFAIDLPRLWPVLGDELPVLATAVETELARRAALLPASKGS
jgi:uncharacterized protein with HEPN domain